MKRFKTTYIIALITIAAFVIIGELAVQLGLSTLSDDSRIINLSGRQRMLSQRITKNALVLNQTSDYNEFQARKKELIEALANWRKAHEALQKGDITLGIKKAENTKEIIAKFNELQPIFEEMKEAASKITTYDFNSLDSAARVELNANTQVLLDNEVKFLPIMDEITFIYDKDSKGKTNTTGAIAWIVGVSIIGLIILLAFFFFEPVVKKMNAYLQEIETQNKKIQASEAEIRQIAEKQLEANEQLSLAQKQAQEKNIELEKAKQATEKLLKEQEEANKKLAIAQRELQKTLAEQNRTNQKLIEAQQELTQKAENLEKSEQRIRLIAEEQHIANEKLKLAQQELTQKAEELERSEKEMRTLAEAQLEANEQLFMAQRKMQEAQKELQRLSLVASKTDNAVIISDADGLIEWVNEGFERLTEYKLEEVKGKKPGKFLQGAETNPADVQTIREGLASRRPFYAEIYNYSKSGKGYWLGLNITPIFDENGSLTQFIAIETDISERKQAELEIKNLLEMQSVINDTLMLAQEEAAQKAQELEHSEREMRMLAEAQLEANEKLMLAEKQLKETLALEQKQKAELDRLVAQLKETQTQLVHNEKMASLGQLTAGIAHEINNPINFVYNGIDTLKISLDDLMEIINKYNELDQSNGNKEEIIEEVKKLKENLDYEELTQDIEHLVSDIKKGAVRTMEIVKGLRVFSRLDEEERKMASIKDCLDSTLILLNNKIKGRIELKTYYDETMPEILCYPGQLNQVFMNIINNAIQAIPEGRKDGVISIYTENMQENVVIRIKDNGTGMSEQVKRRIFEPFFTTKQVGVGTGLGLSITFGIIEKHEGSIFVNSEEGRGTEFVIQLPKQKGG